MKRKMFLIILFSCSCVFFFAACALTEHKLTEELQLPLISGENSEESQALPLSEEDSEESHDLPGSREDSEESQISPADEEESEGLQIPSAGEEDTKEPWVPLSGECELENPQLLPTGREVDPDIDLLNETHQYYDIGNLTSCFKIEIPKESQNIDPDSFAFGFETIEPSDAMKEWVQSIIDSGELARICFAGGLVAADGTDIRGETLIITKPVTGHQITDGEIQKDLLPVDPFKGTCFVIYQNQIICSFMRAVMPDGQLSVANSIGIREQLMNEYCHDDLNRRICTAHDGVTQPKLYFLLPEEGTEQYHENQNPVMMTFVSPETVN